MACSTPVICSDIPCFKEIAGNAAVFFEKNNYINLSEKISLLLSDKNIQVELLKNGIEKIKHFNWNDTVDKHVMVFHEILDNDNS